MGLFSGTRPEHVGVRDGRLVPAKRTPNNVNSQADRTADPEHYIEPLRYSGDARQAWAALRKIVDGMSRTKVIKSEPDYLYAEFATRLMRFVDDVEFYLDEKAGVIQVRSASRLGSGDFGVNRERVETIRVKLKCAYATKPLCHAAARILGQTRKVTPGERTISASRLTKESVMHISLIKLLGALLMIASITGCASISGGSPGQFSDPYAYADSYAQ